MKHARRLLLALLLVSVPASLGAAGTDPLWGRAVESARAAAQWVPGRASFLIEVVDDAGHPKETWELSYRISRSASGGVVTDVVHAAHNGTDTTRSEQDAQRKRKPVPFSMGDNPFDPALQAAVDARTGGVEESIADRVCVRYNFTAKKKDGSVLTGTAWIDAATGAPVEARYSVSPLPRGVRQMTTTLRYAAGPDGDGFLAEAYVEGVAGFLFLTRAFRTTVTVDDYWRRGG